MTEKLLMDLMRVAYLAGFNASGEGYNGEYSFNDNGESPENDGMWTDVRDEKIRIILEGLDND